MKRTIYIIVFVILSFTAKSQYCMNYLYSVGCYDSILGSFRIDSLSFGTYINITASPCSNFTSYCGFTGINFNPTCLFQGNTYNMKFKIQSPLQSNYIKVWIDYDNDTILNDSTELIYQLNNVTSGFYNQNITIPLQLDSGTYRMRIRLVAGTNFNSACDTATYGETHDYTVHLGNFKLVAIDSIITPFDSIISYYPNYPKVKLRNIGSVPVFNLKMYYKINYYQPVYTIITDTILPGDTVYWTFTTPYSVPGSNFNICFNVIYDSTTFYGNCNYCKYVKVKPPEHDVGVIQLLSPGDTFPYDTALNLIVSIENRGTTTETSIPVYYQKLAQTPVAETWTGVLMPGDTAHYTFQTTFIVPSYTALNLCAWTSLSADPNTLNNKLCRTISWYHVPPAPAIITSIPANIHSVQSGQIITFYINNVNGATSYLWSYSSSGVSFTGNDTSIKVTILPNIQPGYFIVRGQNIYGNGPPSPMYLLSVEGIIENSISNSIKLFPIPTSEKLTIECNFIKKGKTKFSIFNIHGSILFNEENLITTDTYTKIIEVGNLKAGIYFIKIENEAGVYNNKFIKE